MVQIANIGFNPTNFTQKDGSVVEILPGEARAVDLPRDDINVKAREDAGLISVGGTKTQAEKAAREAPLVSAPDPKAKPAE